DGAWACRRRLRLGRGGQVHMERMNEKRPAVRLLLDDLRGRLAGAVSRLRLDTNQHGLGAPLRGLQCRRVLEGMSGYDAIIVISRGDEHRGVASPRPQVVQWGIPIEKWELADTVG